MKMLERKLNYTNIKPIFSYTKLNKTEVREASGQSNIKRKKKKERRVGRCQGIDMKNSNSFSLYLL